MFCKVILLEKESDKEYAYSTNLTDLKRGDHVIAPVLEEKTIAMFCRYVDESDLGLPAGVKLKEITERVEE